MSATLEALGLDSSTAEFLQSVPDDLVAGRVARVDKGLATVFTEDGPVRASWSGALLAEIAADAQAGPCTGDWVVLRFWPDDRITLESVLPRRTTIVRAEVGGSSPPPNVIVSGLWRPPSTALHCVASPSSFAGRNAMGGSVHLVALYC